MRTLFLDYRYAARSLRQAPGTALTAIITLALGIASTTVVFSAVNVILLQPLLYPNAERLYVIHWRIGPHNSEGDVSANLLFRLKDDARSFESVSAIYPVGSGANLSGAGNPQHVQVLRVSENFFHTLGVLPVFGTDFEAVKDHREGEAQTAILSYAFWHRNFNDDRAVLGRKLKINGEIYIIVGVMPAEFHTSPAADVWLCLPWSRAAVDQGSNYRPYVTLRSEVTLGQAREELRTLSQRYRQEYPLTPPDQELVLHRLKDYLVQDVRPSLLVLFGAVLFVLLIACTNVAAILIMRISARTHEIALRSALGESRGRLVRRFLIESSILGIIGGLIGLIVAKETLPWTLSLLPPDASLKVPVSIDRTVLLFTLAVSLLTALLSGLAPGLSISYRNLSELLRQAPLGMTSGIKQVKLGRIMVSGQAALTIVLLSGSLVLLNGFLGLRSVAPGFDARQVSVVQLSLTGERYRASAAREALVAGVLDRMRNYGDFESIGVINGLPMEKGLNLPAYPVEASGKMEAVQYRIIGDQYFAALRIPLVQGRFFSETTGRAMHPVAIINKTLAQKWWPRTSPLGQYINIAAGPELTDTPREIVGVVADVHETGLAWPAAPTIFIPFTQASDSITELADDWFLTSIVVRSNLDIDVAQRVRSAVASMDPDLPVAASFPLAQLIEGSLDHPRFYALLTAIFAGLGLLLTATGLYGVLNYQVGLRTRELAVRMAVGARRSRAAALVAWEGMKLVGGGLALGVAGAFFVKKLLSSMLYGASGPILGPISIAAVLMGTILTLAGTLIARRTVSIDPMIILRDE